MADETKTISAISAYDARFSDILGGQEYDDLLIALKFYDEFQSDTRKGISQYLKNHFTESESITVVEAGPGTGITTLEILKSDRRINVIAVDNEEKMLKALQKKFSQNKELKERVRFVLSDILQYLKNCDDNSIDIFSSVYTLHNFTPEFRKQVIELIARKLKHGGLFINGDKYAQIDSLHQIDLVNELKSFDNFTTVANEAEKNGDVSRAKYLREIKKEWIDHTLEDNLNKITVLEQNEMLSELGFEEIQWMKRYDLVTTVSAIKK